MCVGGGNEEKKKERRKVRIHTVDIMFECIKNMI